MGEQGERCDIDLDWKFVGGLLDVIYQTKFLRSKTFQPF